MKKVVLSLAVIASVALVSCGGNKAAEAADSAVDSVVVVEEAAEVVVDSAVSADSAAADTAVVTEVAAVAE